MIFFVWILNFVISWFNAYSVGTVWDSTKARGGSAHFMSKMGATMAASGFTWCYLVVVGLLCSVLPMSLFVEAEAGATPVTGMLLDGADLEAFFNLGYIIIIFPILGSGLAITVQAWRSLVRRRAAGTAGASDYAIVGWDTFAQVHNTYSAFRNVPGVLDSLRGFFGGRSGSSSDDDSWKSMLVIALAVFSIGAGILTTYGIIQSRRRSVLSEDALRTAGEDIYARDVW